MNNSEGQNAKPRMVWIEIARVIAVLSVIVQHLPYVYPVNEPVLSASLALFFILSGYFSLPKLQDVKTGAYLKSRLLPLLKVYLIWNALFALNMYVSHVLYGDPFPSGTGFMETVLMWLGIGHVPILTPMWFVRDLLLFNFLALLFYRLGKNGVYVFLAAGIACLFLKNMTPGNAWPSPYMFGNFCLGLILAAIPGLAAKYESMPLSAHIAVCLSFLSLLFVKSTGIPGILYGPLTPSGVAAILSLGILISKTGAGNVTARLGKATFFVFCIHVFVICWFQYMEGRLWGPWPMEMWLVLALFIYGIAIAIYFILKRFAPRALSFLNIK